MHANRIAFQTDLKAVCLKLLLELKDLNDSYQYT